MAKGTVFIDQTRCKGCTLCITACPQGVLFIDNKRLNAKGYHPATLIDPDQQCTGCAICSVICPDACFTVYREAPVKLRQVAKGG